MKATVEYCCHFIANILEIVGISLLSGHKDMMIYFEEMICEFSLYGLGGGSETCK